jgi:hypothetical protein
MELSIQPAQYCLVGTVLRILFPWSERPRRLTGRSLCPIPIVGAWIANACMVVTVVHVPFRSPVLAVGPPLDDVAKIVHLLDGCSRRPSRRKIRARRFRHCTTFTGMCLGAGCHSQGYRVRSQPLIVHGLPFTRQAARTVHRVRRRRIEVSGESHAVASFGHPATVADCKRERAVQTRGEA